MNSIYNAAYAGIMIYFVRKLYEKLVFDSGIQIPTYEGDGSDCWNVFVGDKCVFYSYDKERARRLARQIKKALPMAEPRLVEDEDIDVEDSNWRETGLNMFDVEELRQIVMAEEN